MAKNKRQPTGRALSAEEVLEREAARFEDRVERARKELAEAEHELERIRTGLKAMRRVVPRDLLERLCLLQPFRRTHGPLSPSRPADLTQCHQPCIGWPAAILSAAALCARPRPLPSKPQTLGAP